MNSKQRILKAINHQETDKIPVDFGSMRSTGISIIAYNNLCHFLALNEGMPKMYDFIQQLAYPQKAIRKLFKVDSIDAGQAFLTSENDWKEWSLNESLKCLIPGYLEINIDDEMNVYLKKNGQVLGKKPRTSLYVDQEYFVYKDMEKIPESLKDEDLVRHLWSIGSPPWHLDIFDKNHQEILIKTLAEMRNTTDEAIMLAVGCNLFETGTWLRGMENFLCDIYLDSKGTARLMDQLVEKYLSFLGLVLKKLGPFVDILQFGDDLGSHLGPFMSPAIFRKVFIPRYKKMWDFVHANSDCKVFLHSCGSIYELLPDLIDAGMDIINPVQTTAFNMEPEKLKKEFGKSVTFWGGGCNTRDILPYASEKEVKEDVKRRLGILSKNGGFIFNQIHNILADVPPQNIVAMFEAVNTFTG